MIQANNAITANIDKSKQSDQGIYEFPPNEDDDANTYSEIRDHSHQQRKIVAQTNEYDVGNFSSLTTSAEVMREDRNQLQDDTNTVYSHFSCAEKSNEDYQTLSL